MDYREEMRKLVNDKVCYWDILAKTPEEKKLLSRIKRSKVGQLCIRLYAEQGCEGYWEEGDTFGSEVVYRVGYEIGHWYQDMEWYMEEGHKGYPDGITPREIKTAEKWVKDAERILKLRSEQYF